MSKWFCTLALLLAGTANAAHTLPATPATSNASSSNAAAVPADDAAPAKNAVDNVVADQWMLNPPEVIGRWLAPKPAKPADSATDLSLIGAPVPLPLVLKETHTLAKEGIADRWMMNPHEVIDRWMSQGSAKATDKANSMMSHIDAARHDVADKTSDLVTTAMGLLGVPYRRGGSSAETGFDCSGFVRSIYSQTVGMVLPRRAVEQAAATKTIDKKELKPGDLVFFNTMRRTFSHVGIYIGDGKFVHSPRSGKTVRVEDMGTTYWKKRFNGARRVVDYTLTAQAQ